MGLLPDEYGKYARYTLYNVHVFVMLAKAMKSTVVIYSKVSFGEKMDQHSESEHQRS